MFPSRLLTALVSESAGELERDPLVAHLNNRACSKVGLLQSLEQSCLLSHAPITFTIQIHSVEKKLWKRLENNNY